MQSTYSLQWVDIATYPILNPGSPDIKRIVEGVREQLRTNGCAVLPGFIRPGALADMASEVSALAPHAYFTHAAATAYGGAPDESFPEGHPRRTILRRENGFVAGDFIGQETGLRQLYHNSQLKQFLADCLEVKEVYEFADPLAQLVINVVKPNEQHAWHFDSNEFVVTIMTQPAQAGGEFEYVPNIRSAGRENYEAVRAMIEGNGTGARMIDLRPGDLQIFFGRYSLHRVRSTQGGRDRHTAILAYSKQAGVLGRSEKTSKIFGRKLPSHDTVDNQRARDDQLTD